jgi:hypothetical protein
MSNPGAKYARQIRQTLPGDTQGNAITIDLYDILSVWPVSAALQHAVKKLLMPGERGHKSREKDLREAIHSIERELQAMAATPDDPPPAPNSPPFEGEVQGIVPYSVLGILWQFDSGGSAISYVASGDGWQARIIHNDQLCILVAYLYHTGTAEAVDDRTFPASRVGLRDAQEWVARRVPG